MTLENPENEPEGHYINANHISNPNTGARNYFIATQGPIPKTVDTFWKMVWQEDISTIVMLCGSNEGGKIRCETYWPEEVQGAPANLETKGFLLTLEKVDKSNPFYWIRTMNLKVARQGYQSRIGLPKRVEQYDSFTPWDGQT